MISNQEISDKIDQIKKSYKRNSIIVLFIAGVVAFLFFSFKYTRGLSNPENKILRREIDSLKKEMVILKSQYATDSADQQLLRKSIEQLTAERESILYQIKTTQTLIKQISYDKVPNYNNVPADSSLKLLFENKFNYPGQ